MDYNEIKNNIMAKLNTMLELSGTIDDNLELSEVGMDSMKAIQFIVEMETSFEITFDDDELQSDHFTSLAKIVDLVIHKSTLNL
jgi:acyl carrier protein